MGLFDPPGLEKTYRRPSDFAGRNQPSLVHNMSQNLQRQLEIVCDTHQGSPGNYGQTWGKSNAENNGGRKWALIHLRLIWNSSQ